MKQWIVVLFLLVTLTGKVLADPSVTPQSGVYAVVSIEPVETNPMADMLLPDIEESMERAWVRFDSESRGAEIYTETQEEPLRYDFDFESQQATSPDNPTAELQLETPEQFVMIHGEPLEVALTFQQIDEGGTEFAALQSAREEWLEAKQTVIERRETSLSELFDVEPISPNVSDPVDWDLPYIFDMPVDWNVSTLTFNDKELAASEGLHLATESWVPALGIGHLLADADTFQRRVPPDYTQETIHLKAPERSLTILMDQEGNLGLLGIVPSDQGEASFWTIEPNDFLEQEDIQTLIAMFYTIRMRDSLEESLSFTDPATWPHYRLTEDSEQRLRSRIEDTLSLEGLLGLMGGQVRVTLFDESRRRSYPDLHLTLVDAEPEPLSPMLPLLAQGNPDEGKITLWEDGSNTQCEASLTLPILSRERETVAYVRISEQVNHNGYQSSDYSQYENCIAAWSALQSFKNTLENDLVTDLPTLTGVLGNSETAYSRDGYLVVAKEDGGDLLRGLLSQEGETILPTQYKKIDIYPDWIVAEDSVGKWVFSKEGEKLISTPLISFKPFEELEGYYILIRESEQGEWRRGLFDMSNQNMIVPPELSSLSYDEEREVFRAGYPDRSKARFSLSGERIGERYASILPLSGTSNYLVRDVDKEAWYFTDEQLEQQSGPYASADLQRAARLVFVRFPVTEHDETEPTPAYFNYDGNRITSPEMMPEYAPSDDGFITVWTEENSSSDISGEPKRHWGLIDRTGEVVIPLAYDQLHQAREGVVPVRRDDAFAIFSVDGARLTDFKWGNLSLSFSGGLMARDQSLNEWQLIDHEGRLLNDRAFTGRPVHAAVSHHETGVTTDMFIARYEQKFGIISAEGEVLVPFEYQSVNTDVPWPVLTDSDGREKRYPDDFRQ